MQLVFQQMADNAFRERLESGRVDLLVGFLPELAGTLKISKIRTIEFACLASRRHPVVQGRIDADTYLDADHIGLSFGAAGIATYLERYLAEAFKAHGRTRKTALNLPSFFGAGHFVADTELLATVPVEFAREAAECLPIQVLDLPIDWRCDFVMAWHLRADEDPSHRWFRALVREVCSAGRPEAAG